MLQFKVVWCIRSRREIVLTIQSDNGKQGYKVGGKKYRRPKVVLPRGPCERYSSDWIRRRDQSWARSVGGLDCHMNIIMYRCACEADARAAHSVSHTFSPAYATPFSVSWLRPCMCLWSWWHQYGPDPGGHRDGRLPWPVLSTFQCCH